MAHTRQASLGFQVKVINALFPIPSEAFMNLGPSAPEAGGITGVPRSYETAPH